MKNYKKKKKYTFEEQIHLSKNFKQLGRTTKIKTKQNSFTKEMRKDESRCYFFQTDK